MNNRIISLTDIISNEDYASERKNFRQIPRIGANLQADAGTRLHFERHGHVAAGRGGRLLR